MLSPIDVLIDVAVTFSDDVIVLPTRLSMRRRRSRRPDREGGIEERVDGAVDERYGVGQGEHELRDLQLVLGPDMDEMDNEIRRPAYNEQSDDRQRHLQGLYLKIECFISAYEVRVCTHASVQRGAKYSTVRAFCNFWLFCFTEAPCMLPFCKTSDKRTE